VEWKYIEYAQRRYSSLGVFNYGEYNRQELQKDEPFDFITMNGVLHTSTNVTVVALISVTRAGDHDLGVIGESSLENL